MKRGEGRAVNQTAAPWPRWVRPTLLMLIAISASLASVWVFHSIAPLKNFENELSDRVRLALSPAITSQDTRISFVSLDEPTMATLPYRSPVDRDFLATLVEGIGGAGAKAVGLDILFDQPTEESKDQRLATALAEFPGEAVIAWADARSGMTEQQSEWLDEFQQASGATFGFVNLLSTSDGVVREHTATLPGAPQPSFAAALAGRGAPAGAAERWVIDWRLTDGAAPSFQSTPGLVIPLMKANPAILETWFKDRIVIIGADLPLVDRHETPLSTQGLVSGAVAGALIHAQIISQILDDRVAPTLSPLSILLIVLLLTSAVCLIAQNGWGVTLKALTGASVVLIYLGGVFYAVQNGLAPGPIASAMAAMALTFVGAANLDAVSSRRERQFIKGAFSQYLAPELVDDLIANPDALSVGGERRLMSFMFTDIAGFTTLSEKMDPGRMTIMLNQYLDGVCEIIIRRHGVIDKFIGDAVVALFGVPNDDPDHAANAILCAREIDTFSEAFRAEPGREDLGETRIGVHTGYATVGNFGGNDRFDYTAIGDAMNTAARLESANKTFGTRLSVSHASLSAAEGRLPSDVRPQWIGEVVLKGKSEPLSIATFAEREETNWLSCYNEAYANLDAAPKMARIALMELEPDPVVAFHLARLEAGETGTTIHMKGK